jgi:hypothetical protein
MDASVFPDGLNGLTGKAGCRGNPSIARRRARCEKMAGPDFHFENLKRTTSESQWCFWLDPFVFQELPLPGIGVGIPGADRFG